MQIYSQKLNTKIFYPQESINELENINFSFVQKRSKFRYYFDNNNIFRTSINSFIRIY